MTAKRSLMPAETKPLTVAAARRAADALALTLRDLSHALVDLASHKDEPDIVATKLAHIERALSTCDDKLALLAIRADRSFGSKGSVAFLITRRRRGV